MISDSFIVELMARGLASNLAERIAFRFPNWEALCAADVAQLQESFEAEECAAIKKAKARRPISRETINRLIDECAFRCCLCWNIDSDSGVIIHHIHEHSASPDDRYENLILLCADHHDKVHTTRTLTRHPFPPKLLLQQKAEFIAAIASFKLGQRAAPGRETKSKYGILVRPPLPPSHFVGRSVVAEDIAKALVRQNGRAAIAGMGGVGKTALALKIASDRRADFPGGILWHELTAESDGIRNALRSWIRSLGRDPDGLEAEEQFALFSALLTQRSSSDGRLLLLLDDVDERVLEDVVKLASYVPSATSMLVTTREVTVGTSLQATLFKVEPLERLHCKEMLVEISNSALIQTEEAPVNELLSLLGDLPLAVELTARQIAIRAAKPGFKISELCQRLREFDDQILSFPGHRGVARSFALSYENLTSTEQGLFRLLGAFAAGPLPCANIASVAGLNEKIAAETLDRLVMVSVLNWGPDGVDYRIHPLLHKYARLLFSRGDIDEQDFVRRRFYQHYTSTAIALSKAAPADLEAIDLLLPNLKKAIRLAADFGDHAAVCETVLGLSCTASYFTSRNLDFDSIPLLQLAIDAAKCLGDRNVESAVTGHLGTAFARIGDIRQAISRFELAAAISRECGNDYDLACHLQNLGGTLLSDAKDLPKAERVLHEALKLAERTRNRDTLTGCFSTLGSLHRAIGNLLEAARMYKGALEISRLAKERFSEGNNLSNLGLVMDQLGHTEEGEQMIGEALAIAMEIGDKRGEGNRTGHLAGILFRKATALPPGRKQIEILKKARVQTTTALNLAQEIGDAEKTACWLMNLGHIDVFERNDEPGLARYKEALDIAQACGFSQIEAQVRFSIGLALVPRGHLDTALGHFRISSDLLHEMHSPIAVKADECIREINRMIANLPPG